MITLSNFFFAFHKIDANRFSRPLNLGEYLQPGNHSTATNSILKKQEFCGFWAIGPLYFWVRLGLPDFSRWCVGAGKPEPRRQI
jgi:hypothetical protein